MTPKMLKTRHRIFEPYPVARKMGFWNNVCLFWISLQQWQIMYSRYVYFCWLSFGLQLHLLYLSPLVHGYSCVMRDPKLALLLEATSDALVKKQTKQRPIRPHAAAAV
jgi:hypothetical protein